MSEQVQLRRGNTAVNSTFIGAQGEVVVDTMLNKLILHDGATAGGYPVASEAYVNGQITITTGNITFIGNTISTQVTSGNLVLVANSGGSVYVNSPLITTGTIIGNINGLAASANNASFLGGSPSSAYALVTSTIAQANNASYLGTIPAANYALLAGATFANLNVTGTIVGNITGSSASAGNVTYPAQTAITSVGTLSNLTVTGTIVSNITGSSASAGNVTYPAQTAITSVGTLGNLTVTNPIVGNITGSSASANNASYLGTVPAANYLTSITSANVTTALGYTPFNNASFTSANIVGNISAGTYVTPTTLDNNTLPASFTTLATSGSATITGNLVVVGTVTANITTSNNAVVYGGGSGADQTIYTGNIQLTGSTPVIVNLAAAYLNTYYRVQVSYNGFNIVTGNAGFLYSTVSSVSQFSIASSNGSDTNHVFWSTFGSNIA